MQYSIYPELFNNILKISNCIFLFVIIVFILICFQKIPFFLDFLKSKNKIRVILKFIKKIPFLGITLSSKIIICLLGFLALYLLVISFFIPNKLTIYPLEWPQSSNFATSVNGLMSPFIAIAAAILTFMAFWVQYNANQNIHKENKKQQEERQFYEMLRIHRENVNKMEFVYFGSEEETINQSLSNRNIPPTIQKKYILVHAKGQLAIKFYLKEFKIIYKCYLSTSEELFKKSYDVFFNGIDNHDYSTTYEMTLLRNKKEEINRGGDGDMPRCSIMNGCKSIFNPYYRHLYLTVRLIVDSNFSDSEKRRFLDILRASLTSEEQTLLLFNWFYGKLRREGYGYKWENGNQHYLTKEKMIHNIVKKDFDFVEEMNGFEKVAHLLDENIKEDDYKRIKKLFDEYS